MDKTVSLLGFAMKAGKITYGTDAIDRGVKLLIVCKSASDNALKRARNRAKQMKVPLITSKTITLDEALHKENCKTIGVKGEMAKAILKFIEENKTEFYILDTEVSH